MREMPKDERPYEKCARLGADSLSDVELLAVLLRTGTQGENAVDLARRVLYHAGENGILGIHQFNVERLKKIKGIGQVKAIQISCISELAKRLSKASYEETVCFTEPKTIAQYYMEDLRHEKQEHMKLLITPVLIYALIEYFIYKNKSIKFNNFSLSYSISIIIGIISLINK